jgi:hypothetical protein
MRTLLLPAAALMLGMTMPAAAQEWTVSRATHTFISDHLVIEVDVDAPGSLRVSFGTSGQIVVSARAHHGVAESGLAGSASDRLVLTAIGADSVEFLVLVPENVRTLVRLPGPSFPVAVSPGVSKTFSWTRRAKTR